MNVFITSLFSYVQYAYKGENEKDIEQSTALYFMCLR